MNIKWLEDFLALVEHGNFTRAAQSRHVTQPAFSRRIRALESWLDAELVSRNTYPLQLTPVGSEYLVRIQNLLAEIHRLRADVREWSRPSPRIVVATQHALSVSYCPGWYRQCQPFLGGSSFCINAMNLYECIESFLAGQCDLLLCYVTPDVGEQLRCRAIERLELGQEALTPVCAVDHAGAPVVQAAPGSVIPLVAFPVDSFFGDLLRTECMPEAPDGVAFDAIYETALSEGIRSMVLNGAGMAWLPAGLVQAELDHGTLVRIPGLKELHLQIALFRHASSAATPVSTLWQSLTGDFAHTACASR